MRPEQRDDRVRVVDLVAPAERELDVAPLDARRRPARAGSRSRPSRCRSLPGSARTDAGPRRRSRRPSMRSLSAQPTGRNANVTTSLPSSSVRNGTSTSSISMPVRERRGIGLGEPGLDLHLAGQLDEADAERHEVAPGRPRVRRRRRREVLRGPRPQPAPPRAAGARPSSVDAQRGHESCAGNVTMPHAVHRLPISCGSSLGQVKRPSATGTRHHAPSSLARHAARSSSLTTLPVAFTGSASRNSTDARHLEVRHLGARPLDDLRRLDRRARSPARRTPCRPRRGARRARRSPRPARCAGGASRRFSISAGYALNPPTMNMSLMRPTMRR